MRTLSKLLALSTLGVLAIRYLSKLGASPEASDRRLKARIVNQLPSMVSQPQAIEVVVNSGDVSLRGDVAASESDQLLSTVLAMSGVKHINNRLALRDEG
ncbi:MAG: BON domain-containing protein [Chitinophagaceae bacterium]|nr:MAG: BON domain-containing protein [Chitinophagaceae bacterium]